MTCFALLLSRTGTAQPMRVSTLAPMHCCRPPTLKQPEAKLCLQLASCLASALCGV